MSFDPDYLWTHPLFILDIESIGLHGEGFAYAFVVMEAGFTGNELMSSFAWTLPERAAGLPEDYAWVKREVRLQAPVEVRSRAEYETLPRLRASLWADWSFWKEKKDAVLVADHLFPVEANFVNGCLRDDAPARNWESPMPFVDAFSIQLAAGVKGLPRLPHELPAHHPLMDVRHTARTLGMAMQKIGRP